MVKSAMVFFIYTSERKNFNHGEAMTTGSYSSAFGQSGNAFKHISAISWLIEILGSEKGVARTLPSTTSFSSAWPSPPGSSMQLQAVVAC